MIGKTLHNNQSQALTISMTSFMLAFCCLLSLLPLGKGAPALDEHCGTWQAEYTELHRSILAQPVPDQKLVVGAGSYSGFSDRLVGAISVFLYGLLSKRAVQFVNIVEEYPEFNESFTSPNIDWMRPHLPPAVRDFMFMKPPYNGSVLHFWTDDDLATTNLLAKMPVDEGITPEHEDFFLSNNSAYSSQHTIYVMTIRGTTVRMFQNPYHRRELYSMGLTPQNAFRCIFNYLFQPLPEVWELSHAQERTMSQHLTIGIQIRTGDGAFDESGDAVNDFGLLERYMHFFECALEVENNNKLPNVPVQWLLMTDSVLLRQTARRVYGSKIRLGTRLHPVHSSKHDMDALHGFLAEHRLLSLSDFLIITYESGVGRTAAFLSPSLRSSVYMRSTASSGAECGKYNFSSYLEVSRGWSEI